MTLVFGMLKVRLRDAIFHFWSR